MFRNRLKTVVVLLMALGVSLNADLLRAEIGVGVFSAEPGGTFEPEAGGSGAELKDDLGIDKANDLYVWAFLKHPVPIIPNVRIEYLALNHAPDDADSFGVNELDGILYYNLLDDTLFVTLDLGIDIKYIEADYGNNETATVGLLYGRGRVEPTEWLGFEAILQATNYGENKGYDARLKVDYTMTFIPVVKPGLEVGYRIHKLQYAIGDILNKAEYSGVYGGLMVRF